jgi:hypothetical protein
MTRSSSPDRREERFDTDDVHHAREVVGEHVQRHLSRHFGQRLHQKVRRPHPHLQRAKRMLDRLATSTHCIRISVQARLHSIDNILVLPPLDATLRSLRALSLLILKAALAGVYDKERGAYGLSVAVISYSVAFDLIKMRAPA